MLRRISWITRRWTRDRHRHREEDLQNRQRPSAAVFFFADALFPKFLKTGIAGEESEGVLDECVNQEKAVDQDECFDQCT